MKLWDFIDSRLKTLGRNEAWLIDHGIAAMTVNRIKAGGTVLDGTKQKIAKALGCTIGDINEALSKREEPKVNVPVGEIEPEVKEVLDDFMENGQAKIPAGRIKWFPDQPVVQFSVDGYKDHLKNKLLKMMLAGMEFASVSDLYREFGQAVVREILGENDADIRKSV